MKLIIIGCEYAGTTTLAHAIDDWMYQVMGARFPLIHDHFKFPHTVGHPSQLTAAEQRQLLALSPRIKETIQRHNLYYHTPYRHAPETDFVVIGLHIEEAIYAQLYFGYGGVGERNDRAAVARQIEHRIMQYAPETVLVLVTASPDVIAKRMKQNSHQSQVLKEQDIELVLGRFEQEYRRSIIPSKLTLDTGVRSVRESVEEFAQIVDPYLTGHDRLRMLTSRIR